MQPESSLAARAASFHRKRTSSSKNRLLKGSRITRVGPLTLQKHFVGREPGPPRRQVAPADVRMLLGKPVFSARIGQIVAALIVIKSFET